MAEAMGRFLDADGNRHAVGDPALVSGFPPSRAGQEGGVTPRNLPLSILVTIPAKVSLADT